MVSLVLDRLNLKCLWGAQVDGGQLEIHVWSSRQIFRLQSDLEDLIILLKASGGVCNDLSESF